MKLRAFFLCLAAWGPMVTRLAAALAGGDVFRAESKILKNLSAS